MQPWFTFNDVKYLCRSTAQVRSDGKVAAVPSSTRQWPRKADCSHGLDTESANRMRSKESISDGRALPNGKITGYSATRRCACRCYATSAAYCLNTDACGARKSSRYQGSCGQVRHEGYLAQECTSERTPISDVRAPRESATQWQRLRSCSQHTSIALAPPQPCIADTQGACAFVKL